jgi:hypothetical protein
MRRSTVLSLPLLVVFPGFSYDENSLNDYYYETVIYVNAYIHIYMHTDIQSYIHTYIHTNIQTWFWSNLVRRWDKV